MSHDGTCEHIGHIWGLRLLLTSQPQDGRHHCADKLILLPAVESSGLSFAKSFRILRVLKAICVATRSLSMQQIINSIIQSMSSMSIMTLLHFIVFVMFEILGWQRFSGLFWRCTDPLSAPSTLEIKYPISTNSKKKIN
jgi:hypothetical protein